MKYTIAEVQKILAAKWLQQADPSAEVEHLLLDSRQITAPVFSLFFALPGKRHDGHRYLADAYKAGVRQFVVSQELATADFPEANLLKVVDTLDALQVLAAWHRAKYNLPVIGITGSNGKTVVKEWLYQLLSPDFNIVRSPKSYNSQVGVPLSVWQIRQEHTLALFEAGISQPGEMERLARIIRPSIGIFTNIGPAHREGFSSKTEKIKEKMRLFDEARTLVYCADHEPIRLAAQEWQAEKPERRTFSWSGSDLGADLQIIEIQTLAGGATRLTGRLEAIKDTIEIPFTDPASVENAVHCWAVMILLGIPQEQIVARMMRLYPVEMRLELKAGIQRCTLINDFYNNDLASLRIALQFASQQARGGRLTVILSDILQSGQDKKDLYAKVAAVLEEKKASRLIGIGADIPVIAAYLPAGFDAVFYPETADFMKNLPQHEFLDELILLKGARPFEFERIARRLEQKAHKTVLEVNLTALVHNLNVYNRLLRPGTKMLAMVKASGYGSGSAEVAKLLEFHQVDYLGVAYADEGIELRQAGVNLPILVLNPEPSGLDAMYRHRLEPEIYSLPLLDELIHFAGREKRLAVHLKLDTGMHRLGFETADIQPLMEKLSAFPNFEVRSVFSHLSASDAAAHDAFTHRQAAAFSTMYNQIRSALGYEPLRHIVNTGGIARFPEYHFDMVRLGIGLYGIDSSGLQDQLRVVNVLKATISQIKSIHPGETVGYNRNGPVDTPTRIATISIGYADGFLRLAGGGRYQVLVRGHRAPTIGNVCMDMTMIDVTRIPSVREGDEVIIFGEDPPVQELANCLQTIPYEVFTNISERVKRVYWQE
ncbi:MAG: bifunctional UDP-N-acetylmuramoyl-tripeptide:D-alanyl-D-alanine ligase/alanine racemase [Lewinellaceae bacterium]|nr:bifunctional UDP-N-acetylmuramoyl-tripeptide:D-alanyl-D-alanine ligase/alanine racemase [Lewinellaceae bacterium]